MAADAIVEEAKGAGVEEESSVASGEEAGTEGDTGAGEEGGPGQTGKQATFHWIDTAGSKSSMVLQAEIVVSLFSTRGG